MGLYFEPGSMISNSSAVLIDHAPHADQEEASAAHRKQRCRAASKKLLPAARPEDELPAGTCLRCGIVAIHATPADCIDQLRDALAEATSAELQARQNKLRAAGRGRYSGV